MRIAPENDLPVICSVCLQSPAAHDPKIRYVNCESGYDGPVVDQGEHVTPVYVENIVICEHCVAEMGRLIGLDHIESLKDHVANLEAHLDQRDEEVKEKDRAILDLTHTVGVLIEKPVKRPAGRPQFKGPEEHEAVIKEMRKGKKGDPAAALAKE